MPLKVELEAKIQELEERIEELDAQNDDYRGQIKQLEKDKADDINRIRKLEIEITDADVKIEDIEAKLAKALSNSESLALELQRVNVSRWASETATSNTFPPFRASLIAEQSRSSSAEASVKELEERLEDERDLGVCPERSGLIGKLEMYLQILVPVVVSKLRAILWEKK